jgi:hypothetical protein
MSLLKRCFQTVFVDGLDGRCSHLQRNPLTRRLNEETLLLEIGEKFTLGFIISVRNVVSRACALSCYLTNSGHYRTDFPYEGAKLAKLSQTCKSIFLFFESVRTMPTTILAAVPPFQVIGSREYHVPFRCEVIIPGSWIRTIFLGWLQRHQVWACVEESVFLKETHWAVG